MAGCQHARACERHHFPCRGIVSPGGACGCAGCQPARACQRRRFLCHLSRHPAATHTHCIPDEWKCDGQVDCPDGSDEGAGCACAGGVRCADGTCADALSGCARGAYCPHAPLPDAFSGQGTDGRSDEGAGCACAGGVRCADGTCADALSGCARGAYCPHAPLPDAFSGQGTDGRSDEGAGCACAGGVRCADGTCADALSGCARGAYCPHAPLPDAFRCDERLCLSPGLLCDGQPHCEDGSDEAPTFCSQKDQVVGSVRQSRALVVCGAVAACAGGVGGAWAALRHWRRRAASPRAPRRAPPRCKPTPSLTE
ncbi:sortilin-related receptor-like [Ostrinia nubilalis]|uniref:sortilin-related receptor-like n=1 Tax=Ostrinia nubilalis TaxID=29057 RepID=UPI00308234F2